MAKEVIDLRWFLLYVSLYVFAIWDSYRGTIDLNKQYVLADREDEAFKPFAIQTVDFHALEKRSPWYAAVLSLLTPGLGHLYIHKGITGVFFIAWTVTVMYMSHAFPAVYATMLGHFEEAKKVIEMQWLMYLPSIYGFVIHHTQVLCVEHNKLFEKEQSKHLRSCYQQKEFKMPL